MGQVSEQCKMKGVVYCQRRFEKYRELYENIHMRQWPLNSFHTYVQPYQQQQWTVMHTGVRIAPIIKYIMPTLSKRKFEDDKGHTSRPFANVSEQFLLQTQLSDFNSLMKAQFQENEFTQIDDVDELVYTLLTQGEEISHAKDLELLHRLHGVSKERAELHVLEQGGNAAAANDDDAVKDMVCAVRICNKMQVIKMMERAVYNGAVCFPGDHASIERLIMDMWLKVQRDFIRDIYRRKIN